MSQSYNSAPDTSPRKMAGKGELIERAEEYLSTIPNKGNCGPHHLVSDLMAEVVSLRAQLASARKALDGAAEYLQKHAARRTIMLSQTSWRPKRSTVEADRNAMVSVENTLRAALKDLPK